MFPWGRSPHCVCVAFASTVTDGRPEVIVRRSTELVHILSPPPPLNINTGVRQMRPTASLHTALHWSPEATTHSTWWDEGSAFERIFAASACRLRLRADKWQGIIVLGLFFFKSWMLYFKFFLWLYFSWPFLGVKGRRSSPTVCYPSLSLMTQAFMELTPSRGDKMTSCWFSSCQWGHFFLSPHRSPPLKTVTVE